MSADASDPSKTDAEHPTSPCPLASLLATVIALTAAVIALMDVFANGLGAITVHLVVGLAVFTAVRISVGIALSPYRPSPPTGPEST